MQTCPKCGTRVDQGTQAERQDAKDLAAVVGQIAENRVLDKVGNRIVERLTILTIDHNHGTNTYLCRTEEVADRELFNYVKENWDIKTDPQNDSSPLYTMPLEPAHAIETYFSYHSEDEWYSIDFQEVIEP
jgi:hypothetical protein